MFRYSPEVMGSYFLGLSGPYVPGSASMTLSGSALRKYGIEYLSLECVSPSFGGGALTRCKVDLRVSFDHLIMKSPMLKRQMSQNRSKPDFLCLRTYLNTMAPGTGGAARKVPGLKGSSTSSPPQSSWNSKVQVPKSVCAPIRPLLPLVKTSHGAEG